LRDRIFLTEEDSNKLRRLVAGRRALLSSDGEYLERLEQELDRAEVVESDTVPRDLVTMNSEFRLRDIESREERVYRLVYPSQARSEHAISVLAPIGTAVLGYRVGDIIAWPVPKGTRRLEILAVHQPEAAAV